MKFMKKNIIFFGLLIFVCINLTYAKSISLQIIQTNGSQSVVFDASYLIEQSIMDYFFDCSYIVSNSPVIIDKKIEKIDPSLQIYFVHAKEGLLDYFVEVYVHYDLVDSNNPEEALMRNIKKVDWKAYLVNDKTLIYQDTKNASKYKNDDDSIIYYSRIIAEDIKKAIELKGGVK